MKNNGIKPKTWKEFSKFKKEVETMLDKRLDNDYILNLLITEGRLIKNGRTLEHKTEKTNIQKISMPLDPMENEKDDTDNHGNPDIQ